MLPARPTRIARATGYPLRTPLIVVCSLLVWSSVSAQGSIASPPGALNQEGEHAAHIFGRYADGRFQFAEGDLKGKAHSFTGISYRLDYRSHTAATAMGRKWSNVTVRVADCDYDKFNAFWNRNALNTPTGVFSAGVEWPTRTGFPVVKPAIWGGLARKLRFPFSTAYVFSGKNDLLLDYEFSGGVLANAAIWRFTDARFYYLDSENVTKGPRIGVTQGFPPSGNCADSSMPQTPGAASAIEARVYSDVEPNASYRGKLRLYHETSYTAPNATVLQAISLTGVPVGIPVGARCNRLHLDLTGPWSPIYRVADSSGFSGRSLGSGEYIVPFVPTVFAGLQIWTQGVWTDSKTNRLALTRSAMVAIPNSKPFGVVPRKKVVYHYAKTLGVAFGPTTGYDANPFLLLGYK